MTTRSQSRLEVHCTDCTLHACLAVQVIVQPDCLLLLPAACSLGALRLLGLVGDVSSSHWREGLRIALWLKLWKGSQGS